MMVSTVFVTIGVICLGIFCLFLFLEVVALVADSDFLGVLSGIGLFIFFIAGMIFQAIGTSVEEVGIYHADREGIEQLISEYSKNPKIEIEYKDNFKEGNIIYEVYKYTCFEDEYKIVIINYEPTYKKESNLEIDFSLYSED